MFLPPNLLGVAAIAIDFALRFNAMLVVAAALAKGLLAGMSIPQLALLGNSFASERMLLLFVLTLPAIGLVEYAGLREHAQRWMARWQSLRLGVCRTAGWPVCEPACVVHYPPIRRP